MKKTLFLLISHSLAIIIGFSLGIFALPILTAPDAPKQHLLSEAVTQSLFVANFSKDRQGSDFLHQGEGKVSIGHEVIAFEGKLSPGPDFKLYLSPIFIETKEDFLKQKSKMVKVGDVKTFNNFIVPVPKDIDPIKYNTVIIWCETFQQYITSASYSLVDE